MALTRLDHSHQNFKASLGRSGALSNRRPPSRSSRASSHASRKSSVESIGCLEDLGLEEHLVAPKVVNIDVHLEGGGIVNNEAARKEVIYSQKKKKEQSRKETRSVEDILLKAPHKDREKRPYHLNVKNKPPLLFTSTPLLNYCDSASVSSEDILNNIKKTYSKQAKSEGYQTPDLLDDYFYPSLDSFNHHSSKERLDNPESSSETEVHISDRESIADSGVVNRRTVIKISEKSKSASNLERKEESPEREWGRNLPNRRSLRTPKEFTEDPLLEKSEFLGGINVSIKNSSENIPDSKRRDSTSRMYVRQGDTENRPTRASAFNVRRTIEKRQIQQERRERKALREQIREHLRSLSEGRHRRDSSCSSLSSSCHSSSSVRSKSLSSLDQDQDDYRSESPLFKAQSSPTLESEKEGIRTYLFGSNLGDTSPLRSSLLVSRIMSPCFSDSSRSETFKSPEPKYCLEKTHKKSTSVPICTDSSVEKRDWDQNSSNKLSRKVEEDNSFHCARINVENNNNNNILKNNVTSNTENKPINNSNNLIINETVDNSEVPIKSQKKAIHTTSEEFSPIPPPRRRSRVSRSTGQLTVEREERPAWLRLAKERSSLRSPKTVSDNFSDRSSSLTVSEPEWVTKARKKLESMNVCLTSVTDAISVSSQVTESSAWSRGGLDALEDLREEVSCLSEELAEEASERVEKELGIADRSRSANMIEYPKPKGSREPSAERQRVSFDGTAVQNEKHKKVSQQSNSQKDEVRFGDLKHDWGGVQAKSSRIINGKHKETRFGEIHFSEAIRDDKQEDNLTNGLVHKNGKRELTPSPEFCTIPNGEVKSNSKSEKLTFMHFGDTPQDIFTKNTSNIKSQSSSKFESIAGPDPTKMTAEELNQNVEEYDFPIPTGKEDASELMNLLKESLNKQEIIPEFVSNEDSLPKPKSILKRKSIENCPILEIKKEEGAKPQEVQPISNSKEPTSKIGKNFLLHHKISDKNMHDRLNVVNIEKTAVDAKRTSEAIEAFKSNKRNDTSDKSLSKFNLTNTQSSVTNAASNFFNVKLRHVGTNKSLKIEDSLSEPKKFGSLIEESPSPPLKQNKNFPSLECYINIISETKSSKDTAVPNNKTPNKTNGMSGKIKALKTSFETGIQETSPGTCQEVSLGTNIRHSTTKTIFEQKSNCVSLQVEAKNEIKTVSSVFNLAAGLIPQETEHSAKSSMKVLNNIKETDLLRPAASKTAWMSCRSGQLSQTGTVFILHSRFILKKKINIKNFKQVKK